MVLVDAPTTYSNAVDCSICMTPISGDDATMSLPCDHRFHSACLAPWLWKNRSCPNCRLSPDDTSNNTGETLATIIRTIQDARNRRQRHLQHGMRRALRSDAPKHLQRSANLVRRWRLRTRELNSTLRTLKTAIEDDNRVMRNEYRELYKRYVNDCKLVTERHKISTKPMRTELSNVKKAINRAIATTNKHELAIINFVDPQPIA